MAKTVKKDVKPKAKKEVKKTQKESYLQGVKKEMGLVKWPDGKEVLKNTIATVVFCAIVCIFFILLNLLLSVVKGWF